MDICQHCRYQWLGAPVTAMRSTHKCVFICLLVNGPFLIPFSSWLNVASGRQMASDILVNISSGNDLSVGPQHITLINVDLSVIFTKRISRNNLQ